MTARNDDWKLWALGALLSMLTLFFSLGYKDIRDRLDENRTQLEQLRQSGSFAALTQLADHESRLRTLERFSEKNEEAHTLILEKIEQLRTDLLKRR